MTLYKTIAGPTGSTHVAMTADEEAAFLADQASSAAVQSVADLKQKAQAALDKSDLVATRCFKAGAAFPSEWQTYVTALRSILSTGTGTLPTQPSYPAGT